MKIKIAQDEVMEEAAAAAEPILDATTGHASEWIERGSELARDYAPGIVAGLVVFVLGRWISKFLLRLFRKSLLAREVDATLSKFLLNIASAALLILVVLSAAQTTGIQTTSFVAVLGAATLAIGFALQNSLSNFASGVMIILFRPFKGGDFVEAGGTSGVVEEVGVFATLIRTGDNKKVIIPNAMITDSTITNYSAKDTRRVDMVFGIGYDDDIRKAKEILESILREEERVLSDPAPLIAVGELAESSVNLVCRPWVKTDDYWGVFFHLQETVKLRFDAQGISIPFPQRDVHTHKVV